MCANTFLTWACKNSYSSYSYSIHTRTFERKHTQPLGLLFSCSWQCCRDGISRKYRAQIILNKRVFPSFGALDDFSGNHPHCREVVSSAAASSPDNFNFTLMLGWELTKTLTLSLLPNGLSLHWLWKVKQCTMVWWERTCCIIIIIIS